MIQVPVCIIGCGPIGLTAALLLSRIGIRTLLLERRGALNTHPRSRFVDTNTMELLRELGVEKEVEATGLGPDWTEVDRWADSLTGEEYACIPSPTFHTVPRSTSPCLPVMTAQDHVEAALIGKVRKDPNVDLRFHTEARDLEQTETETRLRIHDRQTGDEEEVVAAYTIGADGPSTTTRAVIGSELESDPMAINSQDVIFHADLSKYVGDRKGALLYATPRPGFVVIFQPLDGVRRWRCQVNVPTPDLLSEEETIARIQEALGTKDEFPIEIKSLSLWQPTPGCTTRFSKGRIFIAGDAAHVSVPTGGMGNNTGFAGIRNLAWKLAFVLRGISPASLLETYQEEHKPLALERIALGVRITQAMIPMMIKHSSGQDIRQDAHATRFYGNYDGTLLGFELESGLIAAEEDAPPPVDDPITDFVPAVRAGRRAPHVWVDEARTASVLDGFGRGYSLVLGADVDAEPWADLTEQLAAGGFPISTQELPAASTPYSNEGLVLVRPDGIIADHWNDRDVGDDERSERLGRLLPRA
ncbi:MAG: FAD-dependent monooxygenase [Myxococcota bacterium]|nr:FAD-dependent monooxygenase [Myxococcota bacterium]